MKINRFLAWFVWAAAAMGWMLGVVGILQLPSLHRLAWVFIIINLIVISMWVADQIVIDGEQARFVLKVSIWVEHLEGIVSEDVRQEWLKDIAKEEKRIVDG